MATTYSFEVRPKSARREDRAGDTANDNVIVIPTKGCELLAILFLFNNHKMTPYMVLQNQFMIYASILLFLNLSDDH